MFLSWNSISLVYEEMLHKKESLEGNFWLNIFIKELWCKTFLYCQDTQGLMNMHCEYTDLVYTLSIPS